jgi:hypothetical protein
MYQEEDRDGAWWWRRRLPPRVEAPRTYYGARIFAPHQRETWSSDFGCETGQGVMEFMPRYPGRGLGLCVGQWWRADKKLQQAFNPLPSRARNIT